jgi:hypothetical protein
LNELEKDRKTTKVLVGILFIFFKKKYQQPWFFPSSIARKKLLQTTRNMALWKEGSA